MIGYYLHHHGEGHRTRAVLISGALRDLGEQVVALTSLPRPPDIAPFTDWVQLARDDQDDDATRHDAGGALHWAPLDAPGYRDRMHRLAAWSAKARPDTMIVDVSVEVATLCRLLGVPVVVVAGAGRRADPAHRLAYELAEIIIAPWNGDLYRPAHLDDFAGKVRYVGAMSRFDGRSPIRGPGGRRVLVLFGAGGSDVAAGDLAAAQRATPGWTWQVHGLPGAPWSTNVWAALGGADVVVTHAGMNVLAETAAARRPAVVLPQRRPFEEQTETAAVLARHDLAVVRERWPGDWPEILTAAGRQDAQRWRLWNDGRAAGRAAHAVLAARVQPAHV